MRTCPECGSTKTYPAASNFMCENNHVFSWTAEDEIDRSAQAVVEGDAIVIRISIANLQAIMDGGFACAAYYKRYKVTNGPGFAKEIADALNDEDEEGSTPVHKLFDVAINSALNSGAQHAEEHPEQEI